MGGLRVIGRIMLSLIFVMAGYGKLSAFFTKMTTGDESAWAGQRGYMVAAGGKELFDQVPGSLAVGGLGKEDLLLLTAALGEVGGGLSLILGMDLVAALILIPFLLIVTPIMHMPKSGQDIENIVQFFKNIGLLGSLLILAESATEGSPKSKKD